MIKPVLIFLTLTLTLTNGSLHAQEIELQNGILQLKEFDVSKLNNLDQATIKVWTENAKDDDPQLAGKTLVKNQSLAFQPRFPMLAGKYRVEVQTAAGGVPLELALIISAEGKRVTEVESIFPSADSVPENMLKFYVHFSAPMRKGEIYKYIKLRERDGSEIDLPFLEIEQEFWSRDSKRLTLLLDPGRIKRGLKPRKEMGPIFEAGKSYELVISGNWPDANGKKLNCGEDFVQAYKATKEDHQQPTVSNWQVNSPKTGSDSPLAIRFPESLDRSMLLRSIQVFQTGKDQPIAGDVNISQHETVWELTPQEPWLAGEYRIEVDSNQEDLCGNSIARQFDVDVFQKTEPTEIGQKAQLEIRIGN